MYNIRPTTKFQKDLKRVKKRGFDISLLTDIIKKLAAWLAACCYIAPTCLYCVKKSTKMIADRGAK